jgi:glycosyltransferase involved in cell wall biosynthesis
VARRIAWVFPGFGVGGAQVRFTALANRFGDECAHAVLSLNGDLACREKLLPGLAVSFPDAGHRPGHMAASVLQARRVLRGLQPDLVVTSNWGAIEWAIGARLARLPHVHTEDGFGPEERARQIPRRVWIRRLALHGSRVVLPSRTLLRIATDIWRLPLDRLAYIPNGIDLARFSGATPAILPPGEGPVVGTVAALRPEKNIARLLHAFAALRAAQPARLVIVGNGPELTALHGLADSLQIAGDVFFAGHSTQAESWLAAFDVFALSSDTEQMPLSLLEAMASGLPCVCTDVGDVRDMLSDANRAFVTRGDHGALADGLGRMLAADRAAIGRANRMKAEAAFDQERMFDAYAELLGTERKSLPF